MPPGARSSLRIGQLPGQGDGRRDALRTLRQLHAGLDGFDISRDEAARVRAQDGFPTYGELNPAATLNLFEALALRAEDRLVDLGSGAGKVALAAALCSPVQLALGIELSAERHAMALQALRRAEALDPTITTRCRLRCADMLRARLENATVVYTCSTAFDTPTLRRVADRVARLPRLRCFASFRDLDPHPRLVPAGHLRLDVSWTRRATLHLYAPRPR